MIARLLGEGPDVLATGGGAYMNPETRARIAEAGVAVWLRADLDVLMRRVRKRPTGRCCKNPDPEGTMRRLIEARHPVYALADVTVDSRESPHEQVVQETCAPRRVACGRGPVGPRPPAETAEAAPWPTGRAAREATAGRPARAWTVTVQCRSASAPTTSWSAAAFWPTPARASRRSAPAPPPS